MNKPVKEKKKITKKHKQIILVTCLIVVITAAISLGLWGGFYYQYGSNLTIESTEAKNIIIMVGDGMGFNHIEAAKIKKKLDSMNMEKLDVHGQIRTRSLSIAPTDSAAAATALATGYKVKNGEIGMTGKKTYENIFEFAKQKGKKVGFVTTTNAYDASIAAFSSHVRDKNMHDEIIKQQIESDIDLIIGIGKDKYEPYADQIETEDRAYCKTLQEIKKAGIQKKKIFAVLDDELTERSENKLKEIVSFAANALENDNNNGYVLLVEGAKIDTYSHQNDIMNMIEELSEFDRAVGHLKERAEGNSDTFMIVTSYYETGDLRIKNIEDATVENMEKENWFHSKKHTRDDVPFFAIGPGSTEIPSNKPLDNTDIFDICKQLIENYASSSS
ncbi:MAG TPA: alkaline phosphatase [Clostridiales bacterium]|nr:alkaline phosphatase [Clostridiales bacterium]